MRRRNLPKTKVRCAVCNRVFSGHVPDGGDGSVLVPRLHNSPDGSRCVGSWTEAEEIVEGQAVRFDSK
jgi:hypothetical protein